MVQLLRPLTVLFFLTLGLVHANVGRCEDVVLSQMSSDKGHLTYNFNVFGNATFATHIPEIKLGSGIHVDLASGYRIFSVTDAFANVQTEPSTFGSVLAEDVSLAYAYDSYSQFKATSLEVDLGVKYSSGSTYDFSAYFRDASSQTRDSETLSLWIKGMRVASTNTANYDLPENLLKSALKDRYVKLQEQRNAVITAIDAKDADVAKLKERYHREVADFLAIVGNYYVTNVNMGTIILVDVSISSMNIFTYNMMAAGLHFGWKSSGSSISVDSSLRKEFREAAKSGRCDVKLRDAGGNASSPKLSTAIQELLKAEEGDYSAAAANATGAVQSYLEAGTPRVISFELQRMEDVLSLWLPGEAPNRVPIANQELLERVLHTYFIARLYAQTPVGGAEYDDFYDLLIKVIEKCEELVALWQDSPAKFSSINLIKLSGVYRHEFVETTFGLVDVDTQKGVNVPVINPVKMSLKLIHTGTHRGELKSTLFQELNVDFQDEQGDSIRKYSNVASFRLSQSEAKTEELSVPINAIRVVIEGKGNFSYWADGSLPDVQSSGEIVGLGRTGYSDEYSLGQLTVTARIPHRNNGSGGGGTTGLCPFSYVGELAALYRSGNGVEESVPLTTGHEDFVLPTLEVVNGLHGSRDLFRVGQVFNKSSHAVWVLTSSETTGPPRAHKLMPGYRTPEKLDFDAVKGVSSMRIDGHDSWTRVTDWSDVEVLNLGSGLRLEAAPTFKSSDSDFGNSIEYVEDAAPYGVPM